MITSVPFGDAGVLAAALKERVGRKVEVAAAVRGQRARWRQMALDNAQVSLAAYLADKRNVFARLIALQDTLGLEDRPERLECFDISHTMGEATVASCVVFDTGGPLKSDYRRFNIDNVAPGDDYAAMEQALRRRYTRLRQGEGALPDVLVIDGGKGQIRRAQDVLDELQLDGVHILGVAKGPGRRSGNERFSLAPGKYDCPPNPMRSTCCSTSATKRTASPSPVTGSAARSSGRVLNSTKCPAWGPKRRRGLLTTSVA